MKDMISRFPWLPQIMASLGMSIILFACIAKVQATIREELLAYPTKQEIHLRDQILKAETNAVITRLEDCIRRLERMESRPPPRPTNP